MDQRTITMLIAYGFLLVFAGVMWYIAKKDDKPAANTKE